MATNVASSEVLYQCVHAALRYCEPYMTLADVDKFASRCKQMAKDYLSEKQAEIEETKSRISFLSLSAELRNHIYTLALLPDLGYGGVPGSTSIYVGKGWSSQCDPLWVDEPVLHLMQTNYWPRQAALTMVSHQLRRETLPIFYGLNRFVANVDGEAYPVLEHGDHGAYIELLPVKGLLTWMKAIGRSIDQLRSLEIVLHYDAVRQRCDGMPLKARDVGSCTGYENDDGTCEPCCCVHVYDSAPDSDQVRRWLVEALKANDVSMPSGRDITTWIWEELDITTWVWYVGNNVAKWMQTS